MTNVVDDAGATEAQRKHTVGHGKSVFNQLYIHSLSKIDVQALFLGEKQRTDHLELLLSLSSTLVRGYPMRLPEVEKQKIWAENPDYWRLKDSLDSLKVSKWVLVVPEVLGSTDCSTATCTDKTTTCTIVDRKKPHETPCSLNLIFGVLFSFGRPSTGSLIVKHT